MPTDTERKLSQPVPAELFLDPRGLRIPRRLVRAIGRIRLPIAGPYRPWATLYLFPDGRRLWHVRLWEVDRAVDRLVGSETLRSFARRSRLPDLVEAIDRLDPRRAADDAPE